MFGSNLNLPPGVRFNDIPGNGPLLHCDICGFDCEKCICPTCPTCDVQGDPKCYVEHGMRHTVEQHGRMRYVAESLYSMEQVEKKLDEERIQAENDEREFERINAYHDMRDNARASGLALLLALMVAVGAARAADPTEDADEPVFQFEVKNRRDPFTFCQKIAPPAAVAPVGAVETPKVEELELKKKEAEAQYNAAEIELMENNALQAIACADKGIDIMRDTGAQDVRERLLRIRKAADGARQRADADKAFHALGLSVSGVVAREKRSQAIINNAVVSKGDVVAGDVVVEEILPDRVVMIYHGYRFAVEMK